MIGGRLLNVEEVRVDLVRGLWRGWMMSNTELTIQKLVQGSGIPAKDGCTVRVHYTGKFLNGTKFDSSVDRDEAFEFVLGRGEVIQGWDEGVATMREGDKVIMTIPHQKAYGDQGYPGAIPPKATLVFEVELLKVILT